MAKLDGTPLNVLNSLAEILKEGTFDTVGVMGSMVTSVLVDGDKGSWSYPLKHAIKVVDSGDLDAMRNGRVDAKVVAPDGFDSLARSFIEVAWTGTDGEVRTSPVDVKSAQFIPLQVLDSTQTPLF